MRLRTPAVRTLLALTLGRASGFCKSFKFGGRDYPKQPAVFVEMRRQSLETSAAGPGIMPPGRERGETGPLFDPPRAGAAALGQPPRVGKSGRGALPEHRTCPA